MKGLISFLIVLLLPFTALGAISGDEAFLLSNRLNSGTAATVQLGQKLQQSGGIKGVFDVAIGRKGSSTVNGGVHNLGGLIPKGSIITRAYVHFVTQFVGTGGASTVAISCEDSGNILAALDFVAQTPDTIVTGIPDDVLANFVKSIAADCQLTATVVGVGGELTAGKANVFVEYVDSE